MTDQTIPRDEPELTGEKLDPITPGEILLTEFMLPLSLSSETLAEQMGVPLLRIQRLLHGKQEVTDELAAQLAERFGTTAEFWLNLQDQYFDEVAR
jgi:addiction module HigA family antidote